MSRYIDADELINDLIKTAQTADFVKVIRCENCLFGHLIAEFLVECQNPTGLYRTVSCDGFCSSAIEKKENKERGEDE